jgi:hypothetical protein
MDHLPELFSNFNLEDMLYVFSAIDNLIEEGRKLIDQNYNLPFPNSIADIEINSFPDKIIIQDAHTRGIISLESAADHLWAFIDLYKEPAKVFAPLTCARGALESSALAIWLLDPEIKADTRVKRLFSIRYEDLNQQLIIAGVEKNSEHKKYYSERLDVIERKAFSLGFSPICNKGKRTGIGQHFPGITELIKTTLGQEYVYRVLSSIAHGDHTYLFRAGFQPANTEFKLEPGIEAFVKTIKPEFIFPVAFRSMVSFAKAIWYQARLYGSGRIEVERFLDNLFDRFHAGNNLRFWRLT